MPLADGLTNGLEHLKASVNARFPNRDKQSDGSWGDKAHKAETSGHNPDDTSGSKAAWNGDSDNTPEVRAWDMDSDLHDSEVTTDEFVAHILSLPNLSSVIRYIIWNRHWWHERDGWVKRDYTGASAHTEHVHFEGAWSNASDANTKFDYKLDELGDNVLNDADKKWISAEIGKQVIAALQKDGTVTAPPNAASVKTNPTWAVTSALTDQARVLRETEEKINQIVSAVIPTAK